MKSKSDKKTAKSNTKANYKYYPKQLFAKKPDESNMDYWKRMSNQVLSVINIIISIVITLWIISDKGLNITFPQGRIYKFITGIMILIVFAASYGLISLLFYSIKRFIALLLNISWRFLKTLFNIKEKKEKVTEEYICEHCKRNIKMPERRGSLAFELFCGMGVIASIMAVFSLYRIISSSPDQDIISSLHILVPFICIIISGIIYISWRRLSKRNICPSCRYAAVIEINNLMEIERAEKETAELITKKQLSPLAIKQSYFKEMEDKKMPQMRTRTSKEKERAKKGMIYSGIPSTVLLVVYLVVLLTGHLTTLKISYWLKDFLLATILAGGGIFLLFSSILIEDWEMKDLKDEKIVFNPLFVGAQLWGYILIGISIWLFIGFLSMFTTETRGTIAFFIVIFIIYFLRKRKGARKE